MKKTRLFTPGPTPLIPESQQAMSLPMPHHRTPEFSRLMLQCRNMLQKIFRTNNELVILSTTGTGAMEAAVANLHRAGDTVLVVSCGKFGERWAKIAKAFRLDTRILTKPYGSRASLREIIESLEENPGCRSLLIQACETSTGTVNDIRKIASGVRERFPEIILIVDGITAVGCEVLETDEWDLDVVVSGSQKSFGIPPGLSFVSLSKRALDALERAAGGPYYHLSLARELAGQKECSPAFTPSIALIMALRESCSIILEFGLEKVIRDAEVMSTATRAGLRALGFRILSSAPANALTAAFPPEGISAEALREKLSTRFGVRVAGGQGEVAGKIIRIAHLGYFDILDSCTVLSALELALGEMGGNPLPGAGVSAALEVANRHS